MKILNNQCLKQTTVAIIMKDKKLIAVGSNHINSKIKECPRKGMGTGVGYNLCQQICGQENHAEVDACKNAGERAKGADLYLIGHYYACYNCTYLMKIMGIKRLILCDKGEKVIL